MSERITFKNGHTLTLSVAEFPVAFKLFQIICREIKAAGVDISGIDLKNLGGTDVNSVKDGILHLLASESLADQVLTCAKPCLIEREGGIPEGVKSQTFNAEDMRGDFFLIAWEVIKANVGPFFEQMIDFKSLIPGAAKGSGVLK